MENLFEIRRYQIDIDNEKVENLLKWEKISLKAFQQEQTFYLSSISNLVITYFSTQAFHSSWENNAAEAQPYYNQFDFPKVNPDYYGR